MESAGSKKSILRWAVPALIWIGPALILWLFWTRVRGMLLDVFSFPFFVLGPGLCVSRLILLFRSHRSVGGKVWRAVLWTLIAGTILFFGLFTPHRIHRTAQRNAEQCFEAGVSQLQTAFDFQLPPLGKPETVTYHYYKTNAAIFESNAHILLCRYSQEDYLAEKASLEEKIPFRTEPLATANPSPGEDVLCISPYAQIGDDQFRFLRPRDGETGYESAFYHNCVVLVTNDTTREIGFIVFCDRDLDVAEDLTKFFREYCGWSVIRENR